MAGPSGDHTRADPQPRVCFESSRRPFTHSEAHRSVHAAASQHGRGSQRLGKASSIPRHPTRQRGYRPSHGFCCLILLGCHFSRALGACRTQPGCDARERKTSQGNPCHCQSGNGFPKKAPLCPRNSSNALKIIPHARDLRVPFRPGIPADLRRKPRAEPRIPAPVRPPKLKM
jgi:hypothetical protein